MEHSGQGERAFGWTFEVAYHAVSGDRIYESRYHVGIAGQAEAKAVLENSITPSEGTEVTLLGPISASQATLLGLRANEIKQE
jgi:hypothetical protein